MAKKLSLLLAAVAVLAFAVPAFANAAPSITQPKNTLVPVGTEITGVSTNTTTKTSLGTLKCASITVHGEVSENTGTSVMVNKKGAATTATCTLNETQSIEITDATLLTLTATSASKTLGLTFEADLPGGVKCHFTTSTAPFTYTAGTANISFASAPLTATPSACGPATISGTFAISTAGGAVVLD